MTRTDDHHHHELSFGEKYLWSTDHKVIAMQYMFTGMAMALIGGSSPTRSACSSPSPA